jgi:hypothetical protein
MFAKALKSMGLKQSIHDPCLFLGHLNNSPIPHSTPSAEIFIGIYVDDFVFFSSNSNVEHHFMTELRTNVVVDFMGNVTSLLVPPSPGNGILMDTCWFISARWLSRVIPPIALQCTKHNKTQT